jgi:TolB-like protein
MGPAGQYGFDVRTDAPISTTAVEEQLQRILASDIFLNSHRLSKFLRFIVAATLKGEGERIKEYLIGLEVFGRNSSYDPRADPVVRVEAGRLRLKLAEYYRSRGEADPLLIELPKGSYVPVFQSRTSRLETEAPPGIAKRVRRHRFWAAVAIVSVIASASAYYLYTRSKSIGGPTSVVVLPFLNLSGSSENDYLSDGVTEELTTALAEVRGLRVVARTSAFQFRGKGEDVRKIGQQLNVGAIMEGSVRRSGDELHVTAQLISTQNGYHLWSGTYDGGRGELYSIEDQIVRQTIRMLGVATTGDGQNSQNRRTENPQAHDLYLEGRYFWNKRDLPDMERSVQLFETAIRKDPNYALAYAGLADTYVVMAGNGQKPYSEVMPPARAALDRALELDPKLPQAHITDAMLISPWDPAKLRKFRQASELSPGYATAHHWYGVVLTAAGHFEEADRELREAQILDPLSPIITESLAENFYFWRRYDSTIEQVQRIREMGSTLGDPFLGLAFLQKRMYVGRCPKATRPDES